jgi:hypothetical protein
MKTILLAVTLLIFLFGSAQEMDQNMDEINPAIDYAWYSSPWMWVAVAALVIIILVALTKGKKS